MPPIHQRRLKVITFDLGGTDFECQVKTWSLDPGEQDGERMYGFCPAGEFIEETDPEPMLELTFYADWRSGGISDFLTANAGDDVAFALDHHPDIPAEHVRWTGTVRLKAPAVGGDARATEETEVSLMIVGQPVYVRV